MTAPSHWLRMVKPIPVVETKLTPPPPQIVKPAPAAEPRLTPPKPQMVKPAPASEPKAEAIPATPPQLHNEIERLKQSWRQVIEQAPEEVKRTPAIAILRSAGVKPVTIEGDTVVLAFRYPIHKEKMEAVENQQVAQKIISNFLGRPCRVRYTHEPENNHLLKAALKMGAQVTSVEEK